MPNNRAVFLLFINRRVGASYSSTIVLSLFISGLFGIPGVLQGMG